MRFFISIAAVLYTPVSRSICGNLIRYFEMSVLCNCQQPDGLFYDVCVFIQVQRFKRKILIPKTPWRKIYAIESVIDRKITGYIHQEVRLF